MEGYHQLSCEERTRIEVLLEEGVGIRGIARRLTRAASTISRELSRNGNVDGTYRGASAQGRANLGQRGRPQKLLQWCTPEWCWVLEKFDHGWTPEQIAGRYRLEHPGSTLSHETIYRFIYDKQNRWRKLWLNLPKKHARRRKRGLRSSIRSSIPGRTGIEERPAAANDRSEVGHWEGDLICFSKPGEVVLHVVERSVRFGIALKLLSKQAKPLIEVLGAAFARLPSILRQSITFDNGSEFSAHQELEKLGMLTFFCNPYASWEKGTVENQNGVLRRYLPRSTNMAGLDQEELTDIREELNDRPMKCLGYKTPREMLYSLTGITVAFHL